ncbi:hypothetical protein [Streptomyces sp. NPDC003077]|uniref:hypothetical protein n=1 Tax=Streptomyces sp. NPDC003077 TaxID=3154443 RepID=UPI0033B0A7CD
MTRVFAAIHGVEMWLANRLLRTLPARLAEKGGWLYDKEKQLHLASDTSRKHGLCHQLVLGRSGRRIVHYTSTHPDATCSRRVSAPPAEAPLWLPDPRYPAGPPGEARLPWRYVLRASSASSVLMAPEVIEWFARERNGHPATPSTVIDAYVAAVRHVPALAALVPSGRTGRYAVYDQGADLLWTVVVRRTVPAKPLALAVHHPINVPDEPLRRLSEPTPVLGGGRRIPRPRADVERWARL